jgi:serine/threonine protein kinase
MRQVRLLAGRYRVLGRLTAGPQRAVWLAEEAASSRPVIVAQVTQTKAQWLGPTVGVTHAHLAQVVRVVSPVVRAELPLAEADAVPEAVAIAELVAGRTLAQAVLSSPLPVFQGVRCTAYVASAVDALHRRGGTHGAISDRSIVVERADEGRSPVLTQLSEPPHATFASPERLHGGGPSQQDDVWALHTLLYLVLVGRPPYRGKDAKSVLHAMSEAPPAPLAAAGIQDERLQSILDRGLHGSLDERVRSVFDLEAELFDWLSANTPKDEPEPARPGVGVVPGPAGPPRVQPAKVPEPPAQKLRSPPQPRTATLLYGAEPQEPPAPVAGSASSAIPDLDPPSPPRAPPAHELAAEPELTPEPGSIPAPKPLASAKPAKSPEQPALRARDSSPSAIPELEAAVVRPSRPRAPKPIAPKPPEPAPKPVETQTRSPSTPHAAAPRSAPDKPVLPKPTAVVDSEPKAEVVPTSACSLPPPASEQTWAPFAYEPGPDAILPAAMPAPTPKKRTGKVAMLVAIAAGALVTVSAIGVGAVLLLRGGDAIAPATVSAPALVETAPVVASVVAPTVSVTANPLAGPTGRTPSTPGDVTRCVSDFFPEGTFDGLQDLAFVCDQPDARKGASTMRSRVVIGARGNVTKGMHEWSRLEWHEIAVWAIFRHACCAEPAPLELPPPVRSCGSVGEAADAVGRAFVTGEGLDDRILQFHRAADCAHYGKAPGYHYPAGPISGGQVTFAGFLERNQKRRAGR